MTGRRPEQPAELDHVMRTRVRLARAEAKVADLRAELDDAIRAASAAGATLRPLAEAAGLSVESVRTIARVAA